MIRYFGNVVTVTKDANPIKHFGAERLENVEQRDLLTTAVVTVDR